MARGYAGVTFPAPISAATPLKIGALGAYLPTRETFSFTSQRIYTGRSSLHHMGTDCTEGVGMAIPSKRDTEAVAGLVEGATAKVMLDRMRERMAEITGNDFPALAALLDLLAESPRIGADVGLCGSVAAVKRVFVRLWDDCEQAAAMGD